MRNWWEDRQEKKWDRERMRYEQSDSRQHTHDSLVQKTNTLIEEAIKSGDPEAFMTGYITKPTADKRSSIAREPGALKTWSKLLRGALETERFMPSDPTQKRAETITQMIAVLEGQLAYLRETDD